MVQPVTAFDHQHTQWNLIVKQNVYFSSNGVASRVDYANIQKNSDALTRYLKLLSSVNRGEFNQWSKNKQKAFLINAYNAFTIQLILTRYPELASIKDIGSFFSNPWKKEFFILLGKKISLDNLEHGILRKKGVYDDPYIHVALVCASIGCPALRNEAYIDTTLEQQLDDSMRRFLSDKERNRYNSKSQTLEVSKIFDWYKNDFNKGDRGLYSINDLFSRYFKELSDTKEGQKKIQSKTFPITYLDYNWELNGWP
jgi:hypothetical protein